MFMKDEKKEMLSSLDIQDRTVKSATEACTKKKVKKFSQTVMAALDAVEKMNTETKH